MSSDSAHSFSLFLPAGSPQPIKSPEFPTAKCLHIAYHKYECHKILARIQREARNTIHIKFCKGLLPDFYEDDLISLKARGHMVISSAKLHYITLLFSGKGKTILRKCYSNSVLGHLKYVSPWFLDHV